MNSESTTPVTVVHRLDALNYVANEHLPREAEPSHRLHEPEQMITTIDPITGNDVTDLARRPTHVDGNITMYFESPETRQVYLDMPLDHPFHLVDNPEDEGEAEG